MTTAAYIAYTITGAGLLSLAAFLTLAGRRPKRLRRADRQARLGLLEDAQGRADQAGISSEEEAS